MLDLISMLDTWKSLPPAQEALPLVVCVPFYYCDFLGFYTPVFFHQNLLYLLPDPTPIHTYIQIWSGPEGKHHGCYSCLSDVANSL